MLIIFLTACSNNTMKEAQGTWKNSNGDIAQVKENQIIFKVDHVKETGILEKPDDKPDLTTTFTKTN